MATANLNDMQTLAGDPVLANRILIAVIQYCIQSVLTESIGQDQVFLHQSRKNQAAAILNNPNNYKPLFVNACCANQTLANDATAGGTIVGQTGATLATSALLCTDTHINNAVASAFNAFISGI